MSGVLQDAVNWVNLILLGSVGTIVAILAVASAGLMMLRGRLGLRYGATVVLGCFILFNASAIADGIIAGSSRPDSLPAAFIASPETSYQPVTPRAVPFDPYAGASVPAEQSNSLPR